jgi:hypothetical protein
MTSTSTPTNMPTYSESTTPLTVAATKVAFIHVTDVAIDSENVTKGLKRTGIDDVADILTLDDKGFENLN